MGLSELSLCLCCICYCLCLFVCLLLFFPLVHVNAVFMRCICVMCMRVFPVHNVLVLVTHVLVAVAASAAAAVETCQKCFALWHILLSLPRDAFCPLTHKHPFTNTSTLTVAVYFMPSKKNIYFEISSTTNSILCHNFPIETNFFFCCTIEQFIDMQHPGAQLKNESLLIVQLNIWVPDPSPSPLLLFTFLSQFAAMFCFSIVFSHRPRSIVIRK